MSGGDWCTCLWIYDERSRVREIFVYSPDCPAHSAKGK